MTGTAADAVERLYREHGQRIWRALFAYSRSREIATDALSEAFAQLLRRGRDVRDPVRWVWRAAFRIAAGELKDRAKVMHELQDRAIDAAEPVVDLVKALSRLSPKQRAALLLHHYAGYGVKDIAGILETSAAAVKVHLSVGRTRLRSMLEERDD
jgi:RNA polymerase sigma factor (sigma-70 family)